MMALSISATRKIDGSARRQLLAAIALIAVLTGMRVI
jgi:hypothetical protein